MSTRHSAGDRYGKMYRMDPEDGRLGRIRIEDERDDNYPMRHAIYRRTPDLTWRYWWPNGWWGNQGETPRCVAFAWGHWAEDGPRTRAPYTPGEGFTDQQMTKAYDWCQDNDRWPGDRYDGTSVRAGAKWLQKKGYIDSYYWAERPQDIIDALLTTGPVVVGTWWYEGMIEVDDRGFVHPTGRKLGGHAYVLNGINVDKGFVRIKNSWGREWGDDGYAYLDLPDMALLFSEGGEACLAMPKGGR